MNSRDDVGQPHRVRRAQLTWKGSSGQAFFLTFDATIRETHTHTSTVTDHPVETGSNVADHIRPDPDALTMDAHISNTPHFLPIDHMGSVTTIEKRIKGAEYTVSDDNNSLPSNALFGLGASILPIPTGLLGKAGTGRFEYGSVTAFSSEFDRVTACYKELLNLRATGTLVRILTTLRSYDDMAITSIEVTREAASGEALPLSLAFKNVRFGITLNEPVPKIPVAPKPKGETPKNEAPVEDDNTSFLRRILNKGR